MINPMSGTSEPIQLSGDQLKSLKERADIDPAHKWTLNDIYTDWSQWERDLARLEGMISERFPRYSDFAGQTMEQVFGEEALVKASVFEVNTLASGYLRNDGERFRFVPFEKELQISPINRFLVDDFNADGKEDILTAANFCGISPYHGRFVSNTGTILSGDGRTLSGLETGINFSQKEIRRITRIRVDNEFYLLAAPNNDYLLWYKIKEL